MSYSAFFNDESQIADRCIWRARNGKSQCSIGKITAINASPVSVNVQPLVNYFDQNAGYTKYPILQKIPIVQFQSSSYALNLPVKVGDTGLLLWFDREAYTTLVAGATTPQNPTSGDMSNQNAAIFLPIVQAFSKANALVQNGVDFTSGDVHLLPQLIDFTDQVSTYLADMNTFLDAIVTAEALTAGSTDPKLPIYAHALSTASSALKAQNIVIKVEVDMIKSKLTTFKGGQP